MGDPSGFYRRHSSPADHVSPPYVVAWLRDALASAAPRGPGLDVGCGAGRNLSVLEGLGRPAGVDLSVTALGEARAAGSAALLAAADAARLPFGDETFGVAVLTEVLEHVPRPEAVVAEAARVLRPGGHLFATSPNYANVAGLRKLWVDRRSGRREWNPWGAHRGGYEAFMTRRRLRSLLEPWFEIEREVGLDAGLGLSGGLPSMGRLAETRLGGRALVALGRGPLAGDRAGGRLLAMTTALVARRR